MIIEPGHETPRFFDWIGPALATWLLVGLVLVVVGVGLALLLAIISRGPGPGYRTVAQRLREGTQDLLSTSPMRILALAQLSVKEAVRKKVFVALVLFAVIIAAAAWYMTPGAGNKPATLYLDFVLFWAITVPVLLVAIFLAVFSLPGEIANRTIYTLVTKPVRPTEIVLGRIIGFTAIGTVMLLVMGIVSYFFVIRTLDHSHLVRGVRTVVAGENRTISGANLTRVKALGGEGGGGQRDHMVFRGRTARSQEHEHDLVIDIAKGAGQTDSVNQHYHLITQRIQGKKGHFTACKAEDVAAEGDGDDARTAAGSRQRIRVEAPGHRLAAGDIIKIHGVVDEMDNDIWVVEDVTEDSVALKDSRFYGTYPQEGDWEQVRYEVGPPQDYIMAQVARYAQRMQFYNRDGTPGPGINVGTEWDYRKAIEGGTAAAVEYYFEDLDKADADENGNLHLQLTLGVFRTVKGDIVTPIPGNIELIHPDGDFLSEKLPFSSNEFERQEVIIPKQRAGRSKTNNLPRENATLFDDYIADGKLIVRITCSERMQYLAMAKRDVYFLAARDNPAVNYIKGCISVWFQLILVTSLGVAFSTFLNGFVALLTTIGVLAGSIEVERIREIASGEAIGGASFESFLRVLSRAPMTTELDPNSFTTSAIVFLDSIVRLMLQVLLRVLPDLSQLSSVSFVSQGFSVPWNNLFVQLFTLLGFIIPLCLFAHYILKGREIAA